MRTFFKIIYCICRNEGVYIYIYHHCYYYSRQTPSLKTGIKLPANDKQWEMAN